MNVFWTEFAKERLVDIFEFYKLKAGTRVSRKLVNSLVQHTTFLVKHPLLGQIEENLLARSQNFRCLIFKNYKLIYWINESKKRIEIVHVFDTRQNPDKIEDFEKSGS
jgi:toxin ParE1/3/4